MYGCFCPEGLTMPTIHFRVLLNDPSAFSFQVDQEGVFLFVWPFELALLRPGVQS
jgi:hypothetical protein